MVLWTALVVGLWIRASKHAELLNVGEWRGGSVRMVSICGKVSIVWSLQTQAPVIRRPLWNSYRLETWSALNTTIDNRVDRAAGMMGVTVFKPRAKTARSAGAILAALEALSEDANGLLRIWWLQPSADLWRIEFPIWLLMLPVAIQLLFLIRRWMIQRRRLRRQACIRCGYDLRASARICPECGLDRTEINSWFPLRPFAVQTSVLALLVIGLSIYPRPDSSLQKLPGRWDGETPRFLDARSAFHFAIASAAYPPPPEFRDAESIEYHADGTMSIWAVSDRAAIHYPPAEADQLPLNHSTWTAEGDILVMHRGSETQYYSADIDHDGLEFINSDWRSQIAHRHLPGN